MTPIITTLRNSWEKNWPEVHAAVTGGLPQFILTRRPRDIGPGVPVFIYHVVNANDFEADLDFLSRNGYVTINADALLDHLEEHRRAPERTVVLTFDDGARNLYEVVFPLLKRYGMTAVAFVAPRFHGKDSEDADSNSNFFRPLSWSQIQEMHASRLIDFQSHTYEHRYVPRWPEPVELAGSSSELVRSLRGPVLTITEDFRLAKETLEQKLGKTVRHLAFPKFNGTREALRIGHECGYRAFWWYVLPNRSDNRPGQSPSYVVRISGEFLRRLPGDKRVPLSEILYTHHRTNALRIWSHFRNRWHVGLEGRSDATNSGGGSGQKAMSRNLSLYELHSLSEMKNVRESWNRLVLNAPTTTPFQSWEWNFGMAKFEGDRVRLRIIVAENKNGEVVGIAPFWIRKNWSRLTVLEFIGTRKSDYLDILCLEPYKEAFVHQLLEWIEQNVEWQIINFQNLRQESVNLLSKFGSFEIQPSDVCPIAYLPATIEAYERELQKKLRQTIHRQGKLLSSDGRIAFSVSRTASQLHTDLPVLFNLHQRRRRTKSERGKFFDQQWREAFLEISLALAQEGFVRLGLLWIDRQPAACLYNLRLRDQEYAYLAGLEPDFARYSPGTLLHHWMIGEAIKDGVRVYDFMRGNEPYKFWWTNEICQTFQMVRARSRVLYRVWRKREAIRDSIYRSRWVKRVYLTVCNEKYEERGDMFKKSFDRIRTYL
jgi:CelD/BcsL family acetyltransferase involved in cellulose biosynthesis/peptidoglycan/xylan/chitin deacetylase (PgdA/CDA1 family)